MSSATGKVMSARYATELSALSGVEIHVNLAAIVLAGPGSIEPARARVWQQAAALCESPIERMMFWALLGEMRLDVLHNNRVLIDDDQSVGYLLMQETIGDFKADFVLIPDTRLQAPDSRLVVIECDGHDFHTSQKRQARDRRIDRELQKQGHAVLRFTGSQINTDPKACAQEVRDFLKAKATT